MRSIPPILLAAGLAACLPAPPPPAAPPEVASSAATALPTAALLDPYTGRYTSGSDTLTVRRVGDALLAEGKGASAAALSLVGRGAFADAQGNVYLFAPGNGGAMRLTLVAANGTRREWAR